MAQDPYTLLVALDLQKEASGDLYLDDSISYAYQKGDFAWKTVTFKNNILESKDAELGAGRSSSPVTVERIVVLGLPQEPAKITNSQDKALSFTYSKEDHKLTIKLPGVQVAQNWSITIQ